MVCVVAGEAILPFLRACDQGIEAIEAAEVIQNPLVLAGEVRPNGALAFILGPGHELEAFVHVSPLHRAAETPDEGPQEDWVLRRLRLPRGSTEDACRLLAAALEAAAAHGARRLHGTFSSSLDPILAVVGATTPADGFADGEPSAVLSLAPDAIARVRRLYPDAVTAFEDAGGEPITGHRFIGASQAAQILGLVSGMSPEQRSWFAGLAGSAERVAQRQGLHAAAAFVRGRLHGEAVDCGGLAAGAPMIRQGEAV